MVVLENGRKENASFRALEGGPVRLADNADAKVVDDVSVRHLLENPLGNTLPETGEKEKQKLERRQMKEEKQQRAALEARRVEMETHLSNHLPVIRRNT